MGDDNGAKNREAAALLRRAANLLNPDSSGSASLRSSSTAQDGNLADHGAAQRVQSSTLDSTLQEQHQASSSQASTSRSSCSIREQEFRRLFAPYNGANNGKMFSHPPAKRGRSNSWGQQGRCYKPQETWTHDFFSLANNEQDCVTTRMEKIKLQKAGL